MNSLSKLVFLLTKPSTKEIMETQNLLVAALTHLIRFQATQCQTAKERALMMFETLSNLKDINSDIQILCNEANELLTA